MTGRTARRVVTGLNPEGVSCIVSDGPAPRVMVMGDKFQSEVDWVWASNDTPSVPHDGSEPTSEIEPWFPEQRGNRLILETLGPFFGVEDTDDVDDSTSAELDDMPTFNARYWQGGIHSSDTIDYAIIISGQLWMQMEDGKEVMLEQGDCVVQTGVRHTWRNRGSEPCRVAFIILGATRTADPEAANDPR